MLFVCAFVIYFVYVLVCVWMGVFLIMSFCLRDFSHLQSYQRTYISLQYNNGVLLKLVNMLLAIPSSVSAVLFNLQRQYFSSAKPGRK